MVSRWRVDKSRAVLIGPIAGITATLAVGHLHPSTVFPVETESMDACSVTHWLGLFASVRRMESGVSSDR